MSMKLSSAIQEALVAVLCYDGTVGGAKLVASLVPAKAYDPFYADIVEQAVAYVEKYGQPPGEHTLDLIEGIKHRFPDKAGIYDQIFASLQETKEGVNRDYVTGQAQLFARSQNLKRAMTQALDSLEQDDEAGLNEAEGVLGKALRGAHDLFHVGTRLKNPSEALRFLDKEEEALPTGIPQLDAVNAGPKRKGLHVFAALFNRGKSWWLINLAKQAMLHRYRVLHLTLEMDEDQVAQRYMQMFFSLTKRKTVVKHHLFERDDLGRYLSFDLEELDDRPHLQQPNIHSHLLKRLRRLDNRPPIIIRQFPTGSLSVPELRGYLDAVEASEGFIPDLILVDYADLMRIDTKTYRHDLGQIYVNLRGIAVERNIAIATATQANREAETAKWVESRHVAEDYSKAATADDIITYSQTKPEQAMGLARLWHVKGRSDKVGTRLLISQAYEMGQFCMDSVGMVSSYFDDVKTYGPDEDGVDGHHDDDD